MGYYINTDSAGNKLPTKGKAAHLMVDGAENVFPRFQENLICVVDNGMFEAAGYCFNEREFEDFNRPDGRSKTWLTHPKAKELSGYSKHGHLENEVM